MSSQPDVDTPPSTSGEDPRRAQSARTRAATISIVVSVVLCALKFRAFEQTGSNSVLSDALESIINVFAAGVAFASIRLAHKPKDRNHPYGHGKIEFISAAFEGGMISFAAILLLYQGIKALIQGVELAHLDFGLAVVIGAGVVNAALGWFLIHSGKKHDSIALVADGHHVLSDFWTSLGVAIGLILVKVTGISWLDPAVALVIALQLGWHGGVLVRNAVGRLLDEEDPVSVERIVEAFNEELKPGIVHVHSVRIIRSGRFHHVDAHVVVPEFWDILHAHDHAERYEQAVMRRFSEAGEIEAHIEPCERNYCARCPWPECPVRVAEFVRIEPITIDEAVRPDPQFPDQSR